MNLIKDIKKNYQIFDHTGDLGITVWGKDPAHLFCHAGLAFFDIITELSLVRTLEQREIFVEGQDLEQLMVNWLGELLYLFETKGLLFNELEIVRINNNGLKALGHGEPFDQDRHIINNIIKAATYHQLKIIEERNRWQARIIFDM
jgi:SHS2 domain-containing protein